MRITSSKFTAPGVFGVLTVGLLSGAVSAAAQSPASDSGQKLREQGKALYSTYCARCHGNDGSDTTTYLNTKSLVDITQRLPGPEIIERSKGFAAVQLEGEDARALLAHLETFRSGKWARPELLVETGWAEVNLKSPRVRVVDMRDATAYAAGHLPGAVRLEDKSLRNAEDRFTYLPSPEAFAEMMRQAGISHDTHVIIYDDRGGQMAARLWYVLNAYGHARVSLLNGGWKKWEAEKRPVSTEVPAVKPAQFTPKTVPTISCTPTELLARKPNWVVLDTRSPEEYRGEQQTNGTAKAGRIPGAVNVDWRETLTGPYQTFKPAPELKKLYESRGVTPDKVITTY